MIHTFSKSALMVWRKELTKILKKLLQLIRVDSVSAEKKAYIYFV